MIFLEHKILNLHYKFVPSLRIEEQSIKIWFYSSWGEKRSLSCIPSNMVIFQNFYFDNNEKRKIK